jgi:hypothetical protein
LQQFAAWCGRVAMPQETIQLRQGRMPVISMSPNRERLGGLGKNVRSGQ